MFINNLSINTPDDVKFQSSILSKLTQTTNQLTRKTLNLASTKRYQLSNAMKSMIRKLSYEDVYLTATYLAECTTNVFNSVYGVLQGRTNALGLDSIRTEEYHKHTVKEIVDEIFSSITSILNLHLNLNQTIEINSSSIYFSLVKLINQMNLTDSSNINHIILTRKIIQPLALFDNNSSYTNLSRSFSLSILDENVNEIKIQTDRIEFFIPRDPNIKIPSMYLQNVIEKNQAKDLFNYHLVNLTENNENLTFSIHSEMHPFNLNLSYLFIYQFDEKPELNSMDNWTIFCPSELTDDGLYIYFLDNSHTLNHQSIIYGIRELNFNEATQFCFNNIFDLSIIDKPFHFSANYEIRTYQSACFYLDSNNHWQSNGLLVGPLTNHYQTQCFSTHF